MATAWQKLVLRAHLRDAAGSHSATRNIVLSVENDIIQFQIRDEQGNILPTAGGLHGIYRLVFWRENYQAEWIPRRKYDVGNTIVDSSKHLQKVKTAGRSGSTPPKWNQAGGITRDGGVTWVDQGPQQDSTDGAHLVLDVHDASIEIPRSGDVVKLDADFLQLLDSPLRHSIRCELGIQQEAGARTVPYYKSFRVGLDNNSGTLSVDLVDGNAKPGGFDAAIKSGLGITYGRHDGSNSNPLDDALGFTMPDSLGTLVKLATIKAGPTGDFYSFLFSIRFEPGDLSEAKHRQLKTFGKDAQGVNANEVKLGFTLIQRPEWTISTEKLDVATGTHSRWILHIFGVHAKVALTEWHARRQDYHRALNIARGGQPVSFLPLVDPELAQGYWVMTYRAIDPAKASPASDQKLLFVPADMSQSPEDRIVLFPQSLCFWGAAGLAGGKVIAEDHVDLPAILPQIGTHSGQKLKCTLPLGRAWAPGVDTPASPNLAGTDILTSLSGVAMSFRQAITALTAGRVRMGALDAEFATADSASDSKGTYWMGIRREPPPLLAGLDPALLDKSKTPDGVSVFSDAVFALSDLLPGGQDDPQGEEYVPERINDRSGVLSKNTGFPVPHEREEIQIEAHFHRQRPVIVTQARVAPDRNYYLRVREDLVPSSSPALRLSIISRKTNPDQTSVDPCDPAAKNRHVIVLDRDPFLVAQVRYPEFLGASEDSGVIAQWSSSDAGGASWQMRFNQQPFCLALPPQGIGDEMVKARENTETQKPPTGFNFSPPALLTLDPRVALTAFSEAPWNLRRILGTPGQPGAGPGVLHMQLELLYGLTCDVNKPAVRLAEIFARVGRIPARRDAQMAWPGNPDQVEAYFNTRREWALLYRRYLARVAVLEPWNNLLPTDNDSPPALLNPSVTCRFRLPPSSNLDDPINPSGNALRGGATWGFESANIYNAVVKPVQPEQAISSSAELAHIALSSEGGWGHVAAGFQGNLTRIIADVSMGRVARYQLERLGRIGVFWNLAKHVIVYERAVAPSRQFQGDQEAFAGWPIPRKVEEYVEILEETRSYPDGRITSTSDADALRRARGFVAHCSFGKENRFNVKSAWGTDVTNGTDRGWKVPLWQPYAAPADIYPKRRPNLGVVGQVAGQAAIIPADVADPQNLFFYTQTDANGKTPNPDPHEWVAVLGVDYVNAPLPAPAPATEFKSGERRTFSADENPVPAAYGPCTFQLDRPASAPDLMTERFAKPMTAFLDSVTMVRSSVGSAAAVPAGWTTVANVETQILAVYTKVLSQIPLDGVLDAAVKQAIQGLVNNATFQNLEKAVTDAQTAVKNVTSIDVGVFETKLRDNAIARLNNALRAPLGQPPLAPLDELAKAVTDFSGNVTADAVGILERVRHTAAQQLLMLESLPGASGEMILRYADGVGRLYADVDNGIRAIDALLQSGAAQLAEAANRAEALYTRVLELYSALLTLGHQLPAPWMPDPTKVVDAALGPYFTQLKDAFPPLRDALHKDLNTAKAALAKFRTDFATYMDPKLLKDFIAKWLGTAITATDIPKIVVALRAAAWNTEDILKQWNKQVDDAVNAVNNAAAGTLKQVLKDQSDILIAALGSSGFVQNAIKALVPADAAIQKINQFLKDSVAGTEQVLADARNRLDQILKDGNIKIEELRARLEQERTDLTNAARQYLDQAATALAGSGAVQAADAGLRLIRAFGDPPRVPQLDFERSKLGYYFNQIAPNVDLSPVVTVVNQGAAVLDALKPLGLKMPTTQALDQLIPPDLKNFDVSKIFPNFAGLDLSHLFSGLKLPDSIAKDNIKVMHGLDAQTRRAFVQTDVHFDLTDPATIFSAGPITLSLPKGGFKATTLVAADPSGVTRKANGEISGDWQLSIGGMVLLILQQTKLTFDDAGGLHFSVDPHNIKMPGVMEFITKLLQQITPKGSGLSVGLLPDGFQSVLKLPLPDVNFGAFGISNLSLGSSVAIHYAGDFRLSLAANLAHRDAPFSLTIFILGGGGFFETEADYLPSTGKITCRAEIAITVSASLAIALGPIKGGVYVYFGITASFVSGQGLTLGVMFLLRGEVSLLGIVSACITLLLEAMYSNGQLIGHGRLTISIKICWCFTLEINEEVTWHLGGGGGGNAQLRPSRQRILAALEPPEGNALEAVGGPNALVADFEPEPATTSQFTRAAHLYVYNLV